MLNTIFHKHSFTKELIKSLIKSTKDISIYSIFNSRNNTQKIIHMKCPKNDIYNRFNQFYNYLTCLSN